MESRTAEAVVKHLSTLGITHLAEWDVLAFIQNHGTSLVTAARMTALLGYDKAAVASALESVTALGLVQRSRNSHGVRVYRLVRSRDVEELLQVAQERQGRLLLIGELQKTAIPKDLPGRGGLHLA